MKNTLILTLILLSACTMHAAVPFESQPIVIGYIGPFTGDAASFGLIEQHVMDMLVEDLNKEGGIHGRPIKVIYEDGRCQGKDAVTAANKLIFVDKVKILSVVCSEENLVVAPLAEANKVLQYSAWPTHADISHAGDYIFRNGYSDADTAEVAAKLLQQHDTAGMLYEQTGYPEGIKRTLVELLPDVVVEGYGVDAVDMRTQITKLIAQDVGAIFLNPNTPASGLAALQQIRELGFEGAIYGNYFGGYAAVKDYPEAKGMQYVADPLVPDSPLKDQLWQRYEERYGEEPGFEFAAAARYDAAMILFQALREVGDDPDKLRDWLYAMPDYTGMLGTYHFDENGDITGVEPAVRIVGE
ncbi:MAG: ABC transporter substrate-binding protein [Candidatus Woesearchaeota archaeon]|jgi:branched-chain amino acid transport system substrate-binding protein|nr:ABC transporter substrate-binding protein [Candidatus Woesearchaeota archaeon]MDP7181438.1 ABC transporter substrate-binding protein [Candidatus Woesearchaeota archaeon]MDP7198480.1 ABC transporter substrate-binding protein [Candidatus Woesearchaeota archaeon]MDP7466778.1 ABC transporter substrate-binding protein [Candidatus Woesearchaeota archaeon]MDP7648003.1 ABC transporter substrate-binding protein [Candidatus Woesearchaeota archaeon]|tara:strand:- start:45 stop:1112 length:1068 start_codon:yes stop_codon:yes gene_type:complete